MRRADAEDKLRATGAGRVVLQIDGVGDAGGDFRMQVEVPPYVHGALRRADFLFPVPEFERCGDAKPGDPSALFGGEPAFQLLDAGNDEIEKLFG
jgi:hypothetical protein